MTNETTSQLFFEEMYRSSTDPWDFASSNYELHRYDCIYDALSNGHYCTAFEPGCSIGVLTARLASLCDRVFASDISVTAVGLARERCKKLANVQVNQGSLQDGPIPENFDLIVLSEIGYYFEEATFCNRARQLASQLDKDGTLLACHWLGESPDHILSGDQVHGILREIDGLRLDHTYREEGFRLDRWRKV